MQQVCCNIFADQPGPERAAAVADDDAAHVAVTGISEDRLCHIMFGLQGGKFRSQPFGQAKAAGQAVLVRLGQGFGERDCATFSAIQSARARSAFVWRPGSPPARRDFR